MPVIRTKMLPPGKWRETASTFLVCNGEYRTYKVSGNVRCRVIGAGNTPQEWELTNFIAEEQGSEVKIAGVTINEDGALLVTYTALPGTHVKVEEPRSEAPKPSDGGGINFYALFGLLMLFIGLFSAIAQWFALSKIAVTVGWVFLIIIPFSLADAGQARYQELSGMFWLVCVLMSAMTIYAYYHSRVFDQAYYDRQGASERVGGEDLPAARMGSAPLPSLEQLQSTATQGDLYLSRSTYEELFAERELEHRSASHSAPLTTARQPWAPASSEQGQQAPLGPTDDPMVSGRRKIVLD